MAEHMREYAADWEALKRTDPEVAQAVADELNRERTTLRLIASENFASPAVLAAMASTMQNKYAEGYPGRRYYGGCQFVEDTEVIDMDHVRDLAIQHRPRLILAGFTAYPRVIDFAAFRQIADEVGALFMVDAAHFIGLVAGGAYPNPIPFADVVTFTTHKTLRGPRGAMILCRAEHAKAIDKAVFPMMQGGPLEHVIAAKAVCLKEAMEPEFKDYASRVVRTARALANGLAEAGLRLVSGGTDSHLALVDLQPIGMTGADAEKACERVGIALNKNAIPFDPLPPATASGIRLGTPGPATLGMDEPEMKEVARIVGEVLRNPADESVGERARAAVRDLMDRFPAYTG